MWTSWSCSGFWLADFLSNSSMARTKVTPGKGEGKKDCKVWTWAHVDDMAQEPPVAVEPPAHEEEAPPTPGEIERIRAETERLEDVGRLPELLPTWQLAQMAAEAGPSTSGGEEPARKKFWLTMGGKAPLEGITLGWKSEEAPKVLAGDSGSPWHLPIPEKYKSPNLQVSLFAFSPWDSLWSGMKWHALPGVCHLNSAEAYLVGLLGDANLCAIYMKCITIMPKGIQVA